MKTYVLTLSKTFPAKHPRKGEPTNFNSQLLNAVWRAHNMSVGFPQLGMKLHTIRANYELWSKRFKQIDAGKAILSIRYWSGKPYHSKQMEICKLTKEDGIGLQKLEFKELLSFAGIKKSYELYIDGEIVSKIMPLANNDGLSYEDWLAWMTKAPKADLSKPLAIIHFTKFRY